MKINLLALSFTFVLILSATVKSSAQTTLPNSGFEQWDSSGQPSPFDWHQPSDWSSTNPVTEFNSAGITKSFDAHSGTFGAQIKSQNIFGTQHAGGLVCGHAKTFFSNYSILPITGGEPVSGKPKKVRGYYKFSTLTSGDSAYVIAINKKWNSSLTQPDTIGFGIIKLPPISTYTLFEIPISDWNALVNPDSIVVAFFSSNPDTGLSGGILIVDDVELDFETGIATVAETNKLIRIYPNPASDILTVSIDQKNIFTELTVFSSLGELILSENISEKNSIQFNTKTFQSGLYWIEMKNKNGELIREKVVKIN